MPSFIVAAPTRLEPTGIGARGIDFDVDSKRIAMPDLIRFKKQEQFKIAKFVLGN
jgi:hypothetical protein